MNKIIIFRKKIGLTQTELASAINITQGALGHYEQQRRNSSLAMARKLVEALNKFGANVSIDDVFPPENKQ
ncbi:putative transcriptional regulator [Nicoletella semolina]|uniref:Putative transcriptional regulator n=1 Tax=Nicoletella semolina TaxID=271160 RepID=A0A4R2NAP8_9PAST|nr:helix-turn-helix transcriptional regulator [Nicoletella semolina]MDH2923961.1 transcriptional regulator [Nicoletella semolina]TCP18084.1 putative transcriptional regulator [Nicoletella semolina]